MKCDQCKQKIEAGCTLFRIFAYLVNGEEDFADETLISSFCSMDCIKDYLSDESN